VSHVRRLNLFIARALRAELNKSHNNLQLLDSANNNNNNNTTTTTSTTNTSLAVYDILMSKIHQLRELSSLHMSALSRFRRLSPEIEFPALHRELFSADTTE